MRWKSPWLLAALSVMGSLGAESTTVGNDRTALSDGTAYVGDLDDSADNSAVETADYPPAQTQMMPQYAPSYNRQVSASSSSGHRMMSRGSFQRAARGDCPSGWGSSEALLWFPMSREVQPLITQATAGFAPIPGSPGYQVNFGNAIEDGITPGFRFDAGRYFGREKLIGFGGRAYGILDAKTSYQTADAGLGAPSIGRFFFDVRNGQNTGTINSASAVALQTINGVPLFTGAVRASTDLNFMGSDIYGRLVLTRSDENQIDMLAGFTTASLDDNIIIDSVTTPLPAGVPQIGIRDLFEADNTFHGAHLGMDTRITHGSWYVSMMTKVNLGNMNQRVNRQGINVIGVNAPALGGVLNTQNFGVFERDVFTFAPELNLKAGVKLRSNIIATVGYSFMYWDRMALAGDQIDRGVDPAGLIDTGPFQIRDSGFFLQGIDLGLTVNY